MDKKNNKSRLIALGGAVLVLVIIIILLLSRCGGVNSISPDKLAERQAAPGVETIELNGDVLLEGPIEVNGSKTLTGSGKILMNTPLEGSWPAGDQPTWGMGCATLTAEDATAMPAALNVTAGASLTLGGSITVDAQNNANGVLVAKNGELIV